MTDTRRYFLKKVALVSGGAGFLHTLPPFIRRSLAINPNPAPPDVILHWSKKIKKAFEPGKKITTQVQLTKELIKMRKKYAPFMADLAPGLPVIRKQTQLKKFSWRLVATEMAEKKDGELFPLPEEMPVSGENPWKEVSIPHYWGPINKAEAHYRKELYLDASQLAADKLFLHFNAVDYIAEVYLNEHKIGTHTGLFGSFEFDIKPFAKPGANLLEVKVFNDAVMMGDSFFLGPDRKFGRKLAACGGPGWNEPGYAKGWTMCPPGFGIWQRCYLETRSHAFINDVYIRPLLDERKAEVQVELPDDANNLQISYSLYGQNFKGTIIENKLVNNVSVKPVPGASGFTAYKFRVSVPEDQLHVWSLDEPWLYQLQVSVVQNGKLADVVKQQFGMRSFIQPGTSAPKGRFYLNGKEIKLRGANMMGNIMQCIVRNDYNQLRDDILLAKIVGMNFWRMTQQPCQPETYEYFDKLGLLAQSDMPAFNGYRKDTIEEVKSQFAELIRMIRSHPCNALVTYLNEPDFTKPMLGEDYHYDESPDYWLVEVSGIPFGLYSEMLNGCGNAYRGMVYGMTSRLGWTGCDPSGLWTIWDTFGIREAKMIGYWDPDNPVKSGDKDIKVTVYERKDSLLIAYASWAKAEVNFSLDVDWEKLDMDPGKVLLSAPAVENFQAGKTCPDLKNIRVPAGKGGIILIQKK